MSLSFTLSQMELFALSEQRYHVAYFAFRDKALGRNSKGIRWDPTDFMNFVHQVARRDGKEIVEVWSEGATYEEIQTYVCVHLRWTALLVALKAMREGGMTIREVRKVRSDFIACLNKVQW